MYWGAMDRFQAHFIVHRQTDYPELFVARAKLKTRGHFASKIIESISWNGPGQLAEKLNHDDELNAMIAKQSVRDAAISIEYVDDTVRIYSKWKNHLELDITKDMFAIYDRIAGHVKSI